MDVLAFVSRRWRCRRNAFKLRLATGEVTRLYGGLTDFESASRLEPASLDRVRRGKKKGGRKEMFEGEAATCIARGKMARGEKEGERRKKKKEKKKAATSFDPQARLCLFTLTAVFLSAYVWAVKRRRARNTLSIPRRRDDARIMVSLIPRRASGARTRYAYATEAGSNYRARRREPRVPRETLAPIRDLFGTIQNWDVRIFSYF